MTALRSRIATALAALGLVVAVCIAGDHGAARAAVGQATGPLIGSPLAGAAVLAANGLAPGDVHVGEITVTNIGDMSGAFALGSAGLTDTPLARELELAVRDVTQASSPALVYSGKLAALSSVALGSMAQGESHRYRFSVSLPADAGDGYQGASAAVTFMWSASAAEPESVPTPTAHTPTPAPARTAEAPPTVAVAGGVVRPRATLTAAARQSAAHGTVLAWMSCQVRCRAVLTGTAVDGPISYRLTAVRRTLSKSVRTRVSVALSPPARAALSAGHRITVRLRLKATMGTRVVVARRTVHVAPARR
jgi:hypothetical protein